MAFGIIELILAPFMIIVTVTSSAYACKAVCCRKSKNQGSASFSIVNADGEPVTIQDLQKKAIPLGANRVVLPMLTADSRARANSMSKFLQVNVQWCNEGINFRITQSGKKH